MGKHNYKLNMQFISFFVCLFSVGELCFGFISFLSFFFFSPPPCKLFFLLFVLRTFYDSPLAAFDRSFVHDVPPTELIHGALPM